MEGTSCIICNIQLVSLCFLYYIRVYSTKRTQRLLVLLVKDNLSIHPSIHPFIFCFTEMIDCIIKIYSHNFIKKKIKYNRIFFFFYPSLQLPNSPKSFPIYSHFLETLSFGSHSVFIFCLLCFLNNKLKWL